MTHFACQKKWRKKQTQNYTVCSYIFIARSSVSYLWVEEKNLQVLTKVHNGPSLHYAWENSVFFSTTQKWIAARTALTTRQHELSWSVLVFLNPTTKESTHPTCACNYWWVLSFVAEFILCYADNIKQTDNPASKQMLPPKRRIFIPTNVVL